MRVTTVHRPLVLRRTLVAVALLAAITAAAPGHAAVSYRAAVVIEPTTWTVLYARDPHLQLPTASMIKMLNALVAMDAIGRGEVTWDTPVRVSREAALVEGSQVYLEAGEVFTVRDLVTAMMVKSANDAAAALAEGIAGSREAYVQRMRDKARALGLADTEVYTPHGLPTSDTGVPEDRSSPMDLARMGAEVLRYPELRLLVSTRLAPFRHGEFELFNPNRLLGRYAFATGIKTGYHVGADFCVTASARRDGMELIAVVMGSPHRLDRFDSAEALLEDAFDHYQLLVPVRAGEVLVQRAPVWGGTYATVPVSAAKDARFVVRRDQPHTLQRLVSLERQPAPIEKGDPLGRVVVRLGSRVVAQVPALAAAEVPEASPWQLLRHRMWSGLLARFASLVFIL
ncbi:MAG TPA: D-alanyl-D-alanine carboxypeptidase family protein [Thermoanaerobaculia bacterium]|nr:D-alanyl-D-alanine carboxypeptidase family protein [Thermoanaerobaculia bacterium]